MNITTTINIIDESEKYYADLDVDTGKYNNSLESKEDLVGLTVKIGGNNIYLEVFADELLEAIDRVRKHRK